MLHDYTQGADALKRRCVGGENSDPSNKQYIVGNDIIERRGYSIAPFDAANDSNNDVLRDRQEYCVRSWLSATSLLKCLVAGLAARLLT